VTQTAELEACCCLHELHWSEELPKI